MDSASKQHYSLRSKISKNGSKSKTTATQSQLVLKPYHQNENDEMEEELEEELEEQNENGEQDENVEEENDDQDEEYQQQNEENEDQDEEHQQQNEENEDQDEEHQQQDENMNNSNISQESSTSEEEVTRPKIKDSLISIEKFVKKLGIEKENNIEYHIWQCKLCNKVNF